MDWIDLVHDRDRWRALVSAIMNLRVSSNVGNFLTTRKPIRSQGLRSMKDGMKEGGK